MDELEKQEEITEEVEQVVEAEVIEENNEFEYIERSKPLGKLVFLVAFTAIILVSSTYAWFSAQKNVTIGGLTGTVNVAEGLEISLDAKHWSQGIDFSKFTDQNDLKKMYGIKADGTVTGHTYDDDNIDANDVEHNIIPSELLPVSTTGTSGNGIGLTDMNMYRGIVNETNAVTSISEVITVIKNTTGYTAYDTGSSTTVVRPQDHDYPGYYAIDLFLRNSTSSTEAGTANYSEILQLNNDSFLQLQSTNALTTGLQNTVRVGFALYEADGSVATDFDGNGTVTSQEWTRYMGSGVTESNYMTASQTQILNAYYGKNIHDVAIWEPNASDHVQYIVDNYKTLPEFSLADTKLYLNPSATVASKGLTSTTHLMRTYALTTAADTANSVTKIYDWATPSTGLAGQITLQTEKTTASDYRIADGVKNLVSVKSPVTSVYKTGAESGVVNFKIQDGAVAKIRMYVWLEGQDVDCINYASHGGGIHLDVGLLKDATVGDVANAAGTTSLGTYLPSGFTEVAAATATSGLTIADGLGNQYVWVEVPTSLYDNASYNTYTTTGDRKPASETDYDNIEYCLHQYTGTYREGTTFEDEFPDDATVLAATGIATVNEYNQLKQKMLSSIYKNGGFYVGKYETGIASSYRDYENDYETEHPITETPVVQANAYPYNWVRCSQAQELASSLPAGGYTTSLMFGVQWDLVLKYLQTSNAASVADLTSDSTEWGNYDNNEYTISNASAKYNVVDLDTYLISEWLPATSYTHNVDDYTLLTTGADSSFGKMGIYDLAGNMWEWTLEYTSISDAPCASRGGASGSYGDGYPASNRYDDVLTYSDVSLGFRVSLY